MSAIKDGRYPITLDKERHLLFSLNVMDAVQDRFGTLDSLPEMMSGRDAIKSLRWLLTLMLNEGKADSDDDLTETQVGRMIHTGNFNELHASIFRAFNVGIHGTDQPPETGGEVEEESSPNAKASAVK